MSSKQTPERIDTTRRETIRHAVALTGAAGALSVARWVHASDASRGFPKRPIQLIVPWTAGGPTDITLRELARAASRELGETVVVENKPGAGGAIAVNTLLSHEGDGYTLMQLPITVFRLPYLQNLSWRPEDVVEPILQISEVTFGVYVLASSRLRTFQDMIAFGKSHPGRLTVGSTGVASTPRLVMADIMEREKVDYIHVPFKGAIDQVFAVQAETIQVGVSSSSYAPLLQTGQLRLLATFDAEPNPRWPNVPTLVQLGYGTVATSPYGLVARRGTSAARVVILHDAFRKAVFDPAHLAALERYDQSPAYLDTTQFASSLQVVSEQERKWAPLIRESQRR